MPAIVLSAVMAECYKKYVLVSLLHQGAVKPAPKYTSSIVQRNLKGLCPQYQDFANAYASNNTDELHKVATQHAEVFTKVSRPPPGAIMYPTASSLALRLTSPPCAMTPGQQLRFGEAVHPGPLPPQHQAPYADFLDAVPEPDRRQREARVAQGCREGDP